MADPRPMSPQIGDDGAWPADEACESCGGAADEAPKEPEDKQGADREARPQVPVGVVVLDRPPAEADQPGEQPVDEPDGQVPDRLRLAELLDQWCISDRYLSWQALQ